MLIFSIDTCSMSSSAALLNDEKMLAQFSINHKKTHSERIMPQVEDMLKAADISIDDIDLFAAAVGPGSFTGVRIGVATAKALAQVKKKPCVAVSALEALAKGLITFNGIISPILDARRNQVYNAVFECKGGELKRLCSDRALPLSDLLSELKSTDKNIMFTGDGVPVFKSFITDALGEKAFFAPLPLMFNQAANVAMVALEKAEKGETVTYDALIPEYVRLSQAEQEKLKKENANA